MAPCAAKAQTGYEHTDACREKSPRGATELFDNAGERTVILPRLNKPLSSASLSGNEGLSVTRRRTFLIFRHNALAQSYINSRGTI